MENPESEAAKRTMDQGVEGLMEMSLTFELHRLDCQPAFEQSRS